MNTIIFEERECYCLAKKYFDTKQNAIVMYDSNINQLVLLLSVKLPVKMEHNEVAIIQNIDSSLIEHLISEGFIGNKLYEFISEDIKANIYEFLKE